MPDSHEIIAGLTHIAHDAIALAVFWHVVVALALGALLAGARPGARSFAVMLSLPLASVSALAWTHHNPFNGAVFAALAVALTALALRTTRDPLAREHGALAAVGWLLVGYAWVYPHFLADRSPLVYLVGSPMGLVPCPTLSLLIGLALVVELRGGRAWASVLAAAGLLYAVIGVARLGVWLDLGLLLGALALLVRVLVGKGAHA